MPRGRGTNFDGMTALPLSSEQPTIVRPTAARTKNDQARSKLIDSVLLKESLSWRDEQIQWDAEQGPTKTKTADSQKSVSDRVAVPARGSKRTSQGEAGSGAKELSARSANMFAEVRFEWGPGSELYGRGVNFAGS